MTTEQLLANRVIECFQIYEDSCSIGIEAGYNVDCTSLLRYVGDDGTFITNQDHGELFGLAAPYNAEQEIKNRIKDKCIRSIELNRESGDLILRLDHARIEIICSSAGYENWQLNGPNGFLMVNQVARTVKW